jgi:hypothetical protein
MFFLKKPLEHLGGCFYLFDTQKKKIQVTPLWVTKTKLLCLEILEKTRRRLIAKKRASGNRPCNWFTTFPHVGSNCALFLITTKESERDCQIYLGT